jgi:hypothetical protein
MPERSKTKLQKPVKEIEPKKVIIEKLPKSPWYKYPPIWIAICALIATVFSLRLTREQYIKSSRPFVWACNFEIPGVGNTIITAPSVTAFRVYNSPARIIKLDINIVLNGKELYYLHLKNLVRYPDEKVIWTSAIVKEAFDSLIVNFPDSLTNKLHKIISIEYSSLNGGKTYHFKMEEYFWSGINQWEPITEEAD